MASSGLFHGCTLDGAGLSRGLGYGEGVCSKEGGGDVFLVNEGWGM